jgi:hypothetical protein
VTPALTKGHRPMTMPTEYTNAYTAAATEQGKDTAGTAIRAWSDLAQSYAGLLGAGPQLPGLQNVVDGWFDLAERALAGQRAVAQQWLSGSLNASATVTEQARRATQSVVAHTENSAEAVVDETTEALRVGAEKAAAVGRAAGDGATP